MTVLKGQAELDSYKLTKKEIADYLGISMNAVRMSMRGSNYHNLEHRKSSKGFLFKVPKKPGDNNEFSAASINAISTKFEYKDNKSIYVLAIVIGLMAGIFYVLVSNAFQSFRVSKKN